MGEEGEEVPLGREIETAETPRQAGALHQLAQALDPALLEVRRRFQHQGAQDLGDGLQPALVVGQPLGVAAGELRHLLRRASGADSQVVAVVQGEEVGQAPFDHLQAMARKVHVGDHLWIQQGDRVAGRGIAEAGVELLGDRRPADDAAPLQHSHLQSRPRQIEGADQAVVPAPDDDDVGVSAH